MTQKILISTGGSGGHVIPATILHEHLYEKNDIIISTDNRGFRYLEGNVYKIFLIDTPKLNLLSLPLNFFKILFLTIKSILFLKKEKVNLLFSTGGYMSLPLILAGKFLNLKIYLLEPNLVSECLSNMQNSVSIPVSIKCRLGIDDNEDYEFLYNFVSIVKESGIKVFIIHARNGILKGLSPRQNRNIPPLKYDYVYRLKNDFPDLEIIINGGIKNLDDSSHHLNKVDGVMIGRAAYDNPFMLKDIEPRFYKLDSSINSKKEVLNLYLEYVERQIQFHRYL